MGSVATPACRDVGGIPGRAANPAVDRCPEGRTDAQASACRLWEGSGNGVEDRVLHTDALSLRAGTR